MARYTIRPIKVGSISYYRGAFNSNQEQYKEREEFPVLIFLLEGEGRKILVDTGQLSRSRHHPQAGGGP